MGEASQTSALGRTQDCSLQSMGQRSVGEHVDVGVHNSISARPGGIATASFDATCGSTSIVEGNCDASRAIKCASSVATSGCQGQVGQRCITERCRNQDVDLEISFAGPVDLVVVENALE